MLEFTEKLGIYAVATQMGKGVLPDPNPNPNPNPNPDPDPNPSPDPNPNPNPNPSPNPTSTPYLWRATCAVKSYLPLSPYPTDLASCTALLAG